MNAIPREFLDASKRYLPDQNAIHQVDQLYAQETTMLSRQAAEIAKKMPKGVVSATEFYEIAVGLQTSYNLSGAREFLGYARNSATNVNDEIGAIRSTANLDFLTGQPNAGRQEYQVALDIFSKYPGFDQYTITSTNIGTELGWAMSEAFIGQFGLALQHVDNAAALSTSLPVNPGSNAVKAQIEQERQIVLAGNQTKPQASPLPLTPTLR